MNAPWFARVGGSLIDTLPALPLFFAGDVSGRQSVVVTVVSLGSLALSGYNRWYLAGRTGASWGKRVTGTRLVSDRTGLPLGVGRAFLRDLAHGVDTLLFCVGWLMPLWTAKRQTLADKMVGAVVVTDRPMPAHARAVPSR